MKCPCTAILLAALFAMTTQGQPPKAEPAKIDTHRGDQMLAAYFRRETGELATNCLENIHTLADWTSRRDEYRRQLFEMLGLDPLPQRTPLLAKTTGTLEHHEFTVEKVEF